MLGYYNISLPGTAHVDANLPCQDSNAVQRLENGWIVASIADGLGSAAHSEIGSKIAVDTVVRIVKEANPQEWNLESFKELLIRSYKEAMEKIKKRAAADKNPIGDYDTTLTTLIYDGTQVAYLHVGDGGIITLNSRGEFKVLTTAQKGDAFNEVMPLRGGEAEWDFGDSKDSDICAILMMTDGIYDVACPPIISKLNQPIRINYVRQFIDRNKLPVDCEEDFIELNERIKAFYSGSGTKNITDDKTIVGIINTEKTPRVRSQDYYVEPDLTEIINEQQKRLYEGEEKRKAAAEEQKQKELSAKPAETVSQVSEDIKKTNEGAPSDDKKKPRINTKRGKHKKDGNKQKTNEGALSDDKMKPRINPKKRKYNQKQAKRKNRAEKSH